MESIKSRNRQAAIARLLDDGRIYEAQVEGLQMPLYLRSDDRALLDQALESSQAPAQAASLPRWITDLEPSSGESPV